MESFTVGLGNPAKRVSESRWEDLLLQLRENAIPCPWCKAENLWDLGSPKVSCWHCRKDIPMPPKLVVAHSGGKNHVLLQGNAKILLRHVDPYGQDPNAVVGQVVQNPNNPRVWGIRNLSEAAWTATMPDGTVKDISPQRAVPINIGIKLKIQGSSAEIGA